MEDSQIVDLYWARNQDAVAQTNAKYGRYLMKIAENILRNREDSEESINDTYLRAWNSMPDNRPQILSSYLGRITRNLAIDLYRKKGSMKRNASQYALSLDELAECLSGGNLTEENVEQSLLSESISHFLSGRPERNRKLFISRYFFCDSIGDIARNADLKEVTVRSILFREREELRAYLEREGYVI